MTEHSTMNKKEIEQHRKDAQAILTKLDKMKQNIEDSPYPWSMIVEYRKEAIGEFLTWLETGDTDHINIKIEEV